MAIGQECAFYEIQTKFTNFRKIKNFERILNHVLLLLAFCELSQASAAGKCHVKLNFIT